MKKAKNLLAFGEILYDIYPSGAKIGGAPLNFTAHFTALGNKGAIYSAVGADTYGQDALAFLRERGIDARFVVQKADRPTGYCAVSYHNGEPSYDLVRAVAYDAVDDSRVDRFPDTLDLFYYGSLALREEQSRQTLKVLLAKAKACPACRIFCDLNLRGSFYDRETVAFCLSGADIVKLNREEYAYCRKAFCENLSDGDDALEAFAAELCEKFSISILLVTLDSDGSFLYDAAARRSYRKGNAPSRFVSAVGAGDSFSAGFLHHYLHGADIDTALEKAATLAAFVVSHEEAIPAYSDELKQAIE